MSESLARHKADADKLKVGQIIEGEQHRDAIHVAVAPVIAAESLRPGEHVSVTSDGEAVLEGDTVGIVDPYLRQNVKKGQRFWLFLYPGSISDMYHHWLHPAFAGPSRPVEPARSKEASEKWLRDFVATADCPDYDTLINAAVGDHHKNSDGDDYTYTRLEDDYLFFGGRDAHGEIPPEFWDHVETVTGRKVPARVSYFACSC